MAALHNLPDRRTNRQAGGDEFQNGFLECVTCLDLVYEKVPLDIDGDKDVSRNEPSLRGWCDPAPQLVSHRLWKPLVKSIEIVLYHLRKLKCAKQLLNIFELLKNKVEIYNLNIDQYSGMNTFKQVFIHALFLFLSGASTEIFKATQCNIYFFLKFFLHWWQINAFSACTLAWLTPLRASPWLWLVVFDQDHLTTTKYH